MPWGQLTASSARTKGDPPSISRNLRLLPPALLSQTEATACRQSGGAAPYLSPFPPPPSLALPCVSKAGIPLSEAPDNPAGKKKDNWGIWVLFLFFCFF